MNILFLTLSRIVSLEERGIYTDLVRELTSQGAHVYIVSPVQKREGKFTELIDFGTVKLLRVQTGNVTQTTTFIEKGLSMIQLESQYQRAIQQHLGQVSFDAIIYSTPPITFNRVIKKMKKKYQAITYLMLKDIFPQNAVDVGLIQANSLLHRYFKQKEKQLYENSDYIGCMSEGNRRYLLANQPQLMQQKVEVFPNAIRPLDLTLIEKNQGLRQKLGISEDATLFVYGGNLSVPQGIPFLKKVINHFEQVENSYLLIVGGGAKYSEVEAAVRQSPSKNVGIYSKLPKEEYDQLLGSADVGLIFLDQRFTIPNIPSRLTSYMENQLPILAATDSQTDLQQIIYDSDSGLWCESGDLVTFLSLANQLASDKQERIRLGANGRRYLEQHFDIQQTIHRLLEKIK